ncbi:hypothetical protein ACFY5J_28600 [Peribacillus butanolivorans]|uniref:hypothetical protein n=1 Tax=Peribacillus butanolivorans TaxID=421767 RepID=UPI00369A7349
MTLDSHSYQIGTTIPLYTLPLGQHTLVVSSSDLAGNQVSKTVHFQTVASIDSLKALVTRIVDSLQDKLANNELKGFVNEVKAQSGKHISGEASKYLLRNAQYLDTQYSLTQLRFAQGIRFKL